MEIHQIAFREPGMLQKNVDNFHEVAPSLMIFDLVELRRIPTQRD